MDLTALRIFVAVMREGSFAAVARSQNLTPSSVSRTISGLERELGLRLFQRTTRRLSATAAGSVYFAQIEPIVDELERARLMAADVDIQPRGRLRVTAAVTFSQFNLVPLLPEFSATYPELDVDLVLSDTVIDLIGERIDVAVRLGQLADSSLIARRLCSMVLVVCASRDYVDRCGRPATPADLVEHNCMILPVAGYEQCWRFRRRLPDGGHGEEFEVAVRGRCRISNLLALGQCALSGMGVALLPRWVVGRELHEGALIDLFPDHDVAGNRFDPGIWLMYPSRSYLPRKVQVFADFVQRAFADGPPGERPLQRSSGLSVSALSR
ncbi:MAG: LysR family transcriptional regulator [Myxococcota bacterium]